MPLRPLATATLSVLVATPVLADDDKTVWRIFVADHAAPRITSLDLSAPETRWTFETTGPSKLYSTAGGEGIVAVQSDDDSVAFLSSGVRLESHGDHSDIAVQLPALTGQIEGPRPFHVVSHDGMLAINFDKGGYPVDAPHMRRIALPFRQVDFALDPQHPQHGWILTEDGSLHRLNLLDARIEASTTLTAPYSMDGHWSDPRPRLALAGSDVLITDPLQGVLRVVDRETLAETAQIPLEGVPYNLVVVGGAGLAH